MGSINLRLLPSWGEGRHFENVLVFLGTLTLKSSSVFHVPADIRNLMRPDWFLQSSCNSRRLWRHDLEFGGCGSSGKCMGPSLSSAHDVPCPHWVYHLVQVPFSKQRGKFQVPTPQIKWCVSLYVKALLRITELLYKPLYKCVCYFQSVFPEKHLHKWSCKFPCHQATHN